MLMEQGLLYMQTMEAVETFIAAVKKHGVY